MSRAGGVDGGPFSSWWSIDDNQIRAALFGRLKNLRQTGWLR